MLLAYTLLPIDPLRGRAPNYPVIRRVPWWILC